MEQMMLNLKFAHTVFGISVIALGIQHFIFDHTAGTKPPPTSLLDAWFLVIGLLYKTGLIALATAIVFNYKIKSAALSLGLLIFVWTLFRHFPLVITNITDPAESNSMFMALAVSGSSFIIGGSIQHGTLSYPNFLMINRYVVKVIGNSFYGMAMVVFGIQHILYAPFIASLIPAWIPGNYFWAYGTGLALITAGISITFEWKSKTSSVWLGIMISLWIVLVHMPRIKINPSDDYEWANLFQAFILATAAFVLRDNLSAKSRMKEASRPKEVARTRKAKKHWPQRDTAIKRI
jgi:uncharacterized membrane protein